MDTGRSRGGPPPHGGHYTDYPQSPIHGAFANYAGPYSKSRSATFSLASPFTPLPMHAGHMHFPGTAPPQQIRMGFDRRSESVGSSVPRSALLEDFRLTKQQRKWELQVSGGFSYILTLMWSRTSMVISPNFLVISMALGSFNNGSSLVPPMSDKVFLTRSCPMHIR